MTTKGQHRRTFPAGVTFTEKWYSDPSLDRLCALARATNRLDGCVVEIGCWEGRSLIALAEVCPGELHAIDTFAGTTTDDTHLLAEGRDVRGRFIANAEAAGITDRLTIWPQDWRDVFNPIAGAPWVWPIRFAHIDADHSYDEVADTVTAVWPHVQSGGVMAGDDALAPPVARAVATKIGFGRGLGKAQTKGALWWVVKP